MTRSATVVRRLTPSERTKIRKWLRRVKKHVRAGRRDDHDDYLVRGDDDLAEAIVDYSSIAVRGWTWPGEGRLAQVLNDGDRNIRKRIARLRAAGLLIVIPPSEGWRSNRYVLVLDGRPLFEVALTSERVRDAIAALQQDGGHTGTPVPPEKVRAFQPGRNERSAESSHFSSQTRLKSNSSSNRACHHRRNGRRPATAAADRRRLQMARSASC